LLLPVEYCHQAAVDVARRPSRRHLVIKSACAPWADQMCSRLPAASTHSLYTSTGAERSTMGVRLVHVSKVKHRRGYLYECGCYVQLMPHWNF
jgi:hypothetical protein